MRDVSFVEIKLERKIIMKNIMIVGSLVVALCSNLALANEGLEEYEPKDDFVCNSMTFPQPEKVVEFSIKYKSTFSNPETMEGEKKSKFGDVTINGETYSNCEIYWSKKPWVEFINLTAFYCRGTEKNIYFETHQAIHNNSSARLYVLYHPNPSTRRTVRNVGSLSLRGRFSYCEYAGVVLF